MFTASPTCHDAPVSKIGHEALNTYLQCLLSIRSPLTLGALKMEVRLEIGGDLLYCGVNLAISLT